MGTLSAHAVPGTASGAVIGAGAGPDHVAGHVAQPVRPQGPLLLSAFAIVLGVAFVAGSFIFTDAMGGAFSGIIKGGTADAEIAPTGANDFDSQQDNRTIPAAVVDRLRALPEADGVHP